MYQIGEKLVSWLEPEAIEAKTLLQATLLSQMPFIFEHVALMPDCHLGRGATVGSVIATDGAIIPAAVGVDIGCGMVAVETNLAAADLPDSLESLRADVERRIPTGIGKRGRNSEPSASARCRIDDWAADRESADRTDATWPQQMGSLGGGNHFIEVCLDERNRVWLVLHSGSRGVGNRMAERHMKVAGALMAEAGIRLADRDLSYLTQSTPQFDDYIRDLRWAQQFARHNRDEMMDRVIASLVAVVPHATETARINCHHNFTQREEHFGRDVWVTRKGAIQMKPGQPGVIPGSMGTRSYIVSGLGNQAAFESAPHGAGRSMSRTEARRRFTVEDLSARMEGIACRVRPSLVDEHPDSYKDVDMVIDRSRDLVRIDHTLSQVLNIKGD